MTDAVITEDGPVRTGHRMELDESGRWVRHIAEDGRVIAAIPEHRIRLLILDVEENLEVRPGEDPDQADGDQDGPEGDPRINSDVAVGGRVPDTSSNGEGLQEDARGFQFGGNHE